MLRKLNNISQKRMAEMLNKSQSAYSRMEKGEIRISTDDLARISKVFCCSPHDLLNENGIIDALKHNKNMRGGNNYDTKIEVDGQLIRQMLDNQTRIIEEMKILLITKRNK